MQLEDHAGDVVGKARAAAGIEAGEVAALLGCQLPEYEVFEQEGRLDMPTSFTALADRLDLDEAKLAEVHRGWEPAVPDLRRWQEIRALGTAHDDFAVNSFLIWDPGSREAALVDTGFDLGQVHHWVSERKLHLRYLLITHGHEDHVAELETFRRIYPQAEVWTSPKSELPKRRALVGESLTLGQLTIDGRETSGHAVDGISYIIGGWAGDAPPVAMVGDALFSGSMGGAGPLLGSAKEMVRNQLFTLPDGTLVCPGHGPTSTVGEEKRHNPFFRARS